MDEEDDEEDQESEDEDGDELEDEAAKKAAFEVIRELGKEGIHPFKCPSNPLSLVKVHETMQHHERDGQSRSDRGHQRCRKDKLKYALSRFTHC